VVDELVGNQKQARLVSRQFDNDRVEGEKFGRLTAGINSFEMSFYDAGVTFSEMLDVSLSRGMFGHAGRCCGPSSTDAA
jgi:hypothetical protein